MASEQFIAPFEFKSIDDGPAGRFTGIANTYGVRDFQDDIVHPGAFRKSLERHGGRVPILQSHNTSMQVGWGISAQETDKGLHVVGEFTEESTFGANAAAIARHAVKLGGGQRLNLSIGFTVHKGGSDMQNGIRNLRSLELLEYSVVPIGASPGAAIQTVKSVAPDLEPMSQLAQEIKGSGAPLAFHKLLRAQGLTRNQARDAIREMVTFFTLGGVLDAEEEETQKAQPGDDPPEETGPVAIAKAFSNAREKRGQRHEWLMKLFDPPRPPRHPWIPDCPESKRIYDKGRDDKVAAVEALIDECKSAEEVEALFYSIGFTELAVGICKKAGWCEP